MEPIQLVDLHSQYLNIKEEVDAAIARVIATSAFIKGPDVAAFEDELAVYTGASHVVGCANGTDALQIALMALCLEPGAEVITPDFTYFATAEVIALLGLSPVLVDVDPSTFTVDPLAIEAAITPRTKVILPVHLYGQCANMAPLLDIARRHRLAVVEDAAQAIGATYTFPDGSKRQAGTMGTLGTTSFFPSKNLGAFGDGGAIFTNDDELARQVRKIANHGQSTKYVHDVVGVNSRLDTLQAAVLRVKLKHLDRYAAARQSVASRYDSAFRGLSGVEIPQRAPRSTHVFHQYTVKLADGSRDRVVKGLTARAIPTSIYYPMPVRSQKAFARYSNAAELPISSELCRRVLSLPMHTEMSDAQIDHVRQAVLEVVSA